MHENSFEIVEKIEVEILQTYPRNPVFVKDCPDGWLGFHIVKIWLPYAKTNQLAEAKFFKNGRMTLFAGCQHLLPPCFDLSNFIKQK